MYCCPLGVRLNKPYSVRVPMDIPVFTGTHADFLVIVSTLFLYRNSWICVHYMVTGNGSSCMKINWNLQRRGGEGGGRGWGSNQKILQWERLDIFWNNTTSVRYLPTISLFLCLSCVLNSFKVFHKIITNGHQRLQPLFDCLLTIIVNGKSLFYPQLN